MTNISYGLYKNARDASWQCLVDYNINKLPVDLSQITKSTNIKIIKNSIVGELTLNESGASFFDGNTWHIVYNDENNIQRSRFTIAHELGHILLGHELKQGHYARTFIKNKPQSETQADIFASRLLSPACVLWGLDIHTPEDIASICNISLSSAKIRVERMDLLYKRNKFLKSPLENQVFNQFKDFINKSKIEMSDIQ